MVTYKQLAGNTLTVQTYSTALQPGQSMSKNKPAPEEKKKTFHNKHSRN